MSRIDLSDLANLDNESTAIGAVNSNNEILEEIMDKALFRTGESPNHMDAVLDMNSNRIINLPAAIAGSLDPIRAIDLPSLVPDINDAQISIDAAEAAQVAAENAAAQAIAAAGSISVGTLGLQNKDAVDITGGTIRGMSVPVSSGDLANKQYADLVSPDNARASVVAATTSALSNSPVYTAATSTALATYEATTNGSLVIDGVTINDGQRVLVKDEATALYNDVYTKSTVGSHWKLTRAPEMDDNLHGEAIYVTGGSTNAEKVFSRTDTTPNYYKETALLIENGDWATNGQMDVANGNIAANTSNISSNTSRITTNTANIATNTSNISALQSSVTNASNLTSGTIPDARLSNTITAGGPTGSSSTVPVITYDAHGRLTAVTTASIAASGIPAGVSIVAPGISGVVGVAYADDSTAIKTLVDANNTVWIFPGEYGYNANHTWPAGKTYKFFKGAYLKVTNGKTLTIKGSVEAGTYKIFGDTATGFTPSIGSVVAIAEVRPEWWGAANDGATDDLNAFNSMWTCYAASQDSDGVPTIYLSQGGSYLLSGQWTLQPTTFIPINIIGGDTKLVTIRAKSSGFSGTSLIQINGIQDRSTTDIRMEGFTIDSDNGMLAARGLSIGSQNCQLQNTHKNGVSDIYITGFERPLYIVNTRLMKWERMGLQIGNINNGVGVTLDTLFSTVSITGTANNGSGKVRLTLTDTSVFGAPSPGAKIADDLKIVNVGGTTEANGLYHAGDWTIVDSTHIDLTSVPYVHAYSASSGKAAFVCYCSDQAFTDVQIVGTNGYSGQKLLHLRTSEGSTGLAGLYFDRCTFYHYSSVDKAIDITADQWSDVSDVWITKCQFDGSGGSTAAINVTATNSGTSYSTHVVDCYYSGTTGKAIYLNSSITDGIYDWTIRGCYFRGVTSNLLECVKTNNVNFIGNVITSNPTSGQCVLLTDALGTALVGNCGNSYGASPSGYFVTMTGTTNDTGASCNRMQYLVSTFENNGASGGQNDTSSATINAAFANRP